MVLDEPIQQPKQTVGFHPLSLGSISQILVSR
jgi:hypothetical protein